MILIEILPVKGNGEALTSSLSNFLRHHLTLLQ